jgi:cyanophycinase-like exopeptidase
MKPALALIGGEEFADGFEDVHAQLAEVAYSQRRSRNGHALQIAFLPTCAAHDGMETVQYWCEQAKQRLGALDAAVDPLPIVDAVSANDSKLARQIAEADWVYLGGGYPHVGLGILAGSLALEALTNACQRGALVSGASGGAMLICAKSWVITPEFDSSITEMFSQGSNPDEWQLPQPPFLDCLGWIPTTLCWPHLNQFFSMRWLEGGIVPPDTTVIGIDEQTAVVQQNGGTWKVLGAGRAVIIPPDRQIRTYYAGDQFSIA